MTVVADRPVAADPSPPTVILRTQAVRRRWGGLGRNDVITLTALSIFAGLAAWSVIFTTVLSGFQESAEQHRMYSDFRTELALQTAPTGGAIPRGTPVSLLSIPKAGLMDAVVVEGTAGAQTQQGPGHLRSSVLPGQAGVSQILGRSLSFGRPFHGLGHLKQGDTITAVTQQGKFAYEVTTLRRSGDPLPPALTTGQARLTLITAEGSGTLGSLAPSHELFVDASLKGTAAIGSGIPISTGALPDSERPMQGDPTALILLVLALQAVVALFVGVVWLRRRWSAVQTWVVAVPVGLAVLWFVTAQASQLLPNLV